MARSSSWNIRHPSRLCCSLTSLLSFLSPFHGATWISHLLLSSRGPLVESKRRLAAAAAAGRPTDSSRAPLGLSEASSFFFVVVGPDSSPSLISARRAKEERKESQERPCPLSETHQQSHPDMDFFFFLFSGITSPLGCLSVSIRRTFLLFLAPIACCTSTRPATKQTERERERESESSVLPKTEARDFLTDVYPTALILLNYSITSCKMPIDRHHPSS